MQSQYTVVTISYEIVFENLWDIWFMESLKLLIWKVYFNTHINNLSIIKKWQYYTIFLHIRLYKVKIWMGEIKVQKWLLWDQLYI